MRLSLALGVALAAMTISAAAQPERTERHVVRHGPGTDFNIDSNNDGWVTRAEANAGAERMFADADSDNDGRLTTADHARHMEDFDIQTGADEEHRGAHHARVIRRGEGGPETNIERDRMIERRVVIHTPPAPPEPPEPPRPPILMLLFASSEESDANGDGALSRDEFRAQQLRFFDASDVNGDGRIRFVPPPEPPTPPEPPAPPTPPAPPR